MVTARDSYERIFDVLARLRSRRNVKDIYGELYGNISKLIVLLKFIV